MQASDWDVPTSDDASDVDAGVALAAGVALEEIVVADAGLALAGGVPREAGVLDLEAAMLERAATTTDVVVAETRFDALVVAGVGTDIVKYVADAILLDSKQPSSYEPLLSKLSAPDAATGVPGRKVMAQIVGLNSHGHIADKLCTIASTMWFGSRTFVQSLLTQILGAVTRGDVILKGAFKFF